MQYYKQSATEYKTKLMKELLSKVGHVGPVIYYFLVQMCVESLHKKKNVKLTEADLVLKIDSNILVSCAHTKHKILIRCLDVIHNIGIFDYYQDGLILIIKFPKLLESLTSDQNRARPDPESDWTGASLKNRDRDKDINIKEKINKKEKPNTGVFLSQIENLYLWGYPRKEGKFKGVQKLSKEIKTEQDLADLKLAIDNYAKLCVGKEKEYIKHFSTFAGCWRDYLDSETVDNSTTSEMNDLFAQYGEEND